jgi:threonine dehydratase
MSITTQVHNLNVNAAAAALKSVALKTPLQFHRKLSEKFRAEIYLKRDDLQVVRS